MAIMLMRLFYGVYFLGIGFFVYHALSLALFGSEKFGFKNFVELIVFGLIWPLALASKKGRLYLQKISKKI